MQTFLVERTIPAAFRHEDPAVLAMHARWATDAYKAVGAFWHGGVITETGMCGLVSAEAEDDLARYARSLNIAPDQIAVRRVVRAIGPYFAAPQGSVRPPGAAR
jgi:hypothetical protein